LIHIDIFGTGTLVFQLTTKQKTLLSLFKSTAVYDNNTGNDDAFLIPVAFNMLLLYCFITVISNELIKNQLFRFHLVAHDWGGVVGWSFAALHPHMLLVNSCCTNAWALL
jgi:hypothetical protein